MKKIALIKKLIILPLIVLITNLSSGYSQDNDTSYTFTGFQVKELLKSAYELNACEIKITELSDLIDSSQLKINILDKTIHDKNKEIFKTNKKARRWRNFSFSVTFVGIVAFIIK